MDQPEHCPECGAELDPRDTDWCPSCGADLYDEPLDEPCDNVAHDEPAPTVIKRITRRINLLWTAVAFFLAVIQACLVLSSMSLGALALFVIPPVISFMIVISPGMTRMARFLASFILATVEAAVFLAPLTWVFPNFSTKSPLPLEQARILGFYLMGWLFFIFVLLPPCIFGRSLIRRFQKKPASFSTFTCILGLFAWLLVGPVMTYFMMTTLMGRTP